eukprot:g4176.t1
MDSSSKGGTAEKIKIGKRKRKATRKRMRLEDRGLGSRAPSASMRRDEKRKRRAVHGNFGRYYSVRNEKREQHPVFPFPLDSRLGRLHGDFFRGRRCLDIGCNAGDLTIAIAHGMQPRSMLGIDIDANLVKRARAKLSLCVASLSDPGERSRLASSVSFQHFDFSGEKGPAMEEKLGGELFDTVSAFSVVKWIHLHGGDDAVLDFFLKVQTLLKPGVGIFVLEPQEWSSYRRRNGSDRGGDLQLRPREFARILEDDFAFQDVRVEESGGQGTFDRPIIIAKRA